MAKIWTNRIIAGTKLFSQCPERYQEDVKEILKEKVAENIITEEEMAMLLIK